MTDHSRKASRKGPRGLALNAAAGGGASIVRILVQVVLLPVMAHLLGPAEFGLYALALPTIWLFSALADVGLGISLAREDENSVLVWSTAFWVLLATGLVLAGVVSGWGVVLAGVSHQPRLSGIMALLSVTLVLITMSVVPSARLTRRGDLVTQAWGDFVSTLVGAVLAVGLAYAGAGAWSLAVQYVTGFLIRAVVFNAAAFYRPAARFDLRSLRGHLATGGYLLGSRMFDFAGRLVENVLFSNIFGAAPLGNYTFANQTPRSIFEAAGKPVWNALYAQALHEPPQVIAPLHDRLLRLVAMGFFPVACLTAAAAPQVIAVLLGSRWATAATMLQVLMPCYALNAVAMQNMALLLANGRNAVVFWANAVLSLGRVLSVCAGLWIGTTGVVSLIGVFYLFNAMIMFAAAASVLDERPSRSLASLLPPLAASAAGALATYLIVDLRPVSLVWLAASLAVGLAVSILVLVAVDGRRLRADLSTVQGKLASRLRRPRPAKAS